MTIAPKNLPIGRDPQLIDVGFRYLPAGQRLHRIAPQLLDEHRPLPSAKTTVRFRDLRIVDAGDAPPHQARIIEFPEFRAIGPVPLSVRIVPFVLERNGDTVLAESPQCLFQPIVEFLGPFAPKKSADLIAPTQE